MNTQLEQFVKKVDDRQATIGVVGMGYVGLPLAVAFAGKGFRVIGIDVDGDRVEKLQHCKSYLKHIPAAVFAPLVKEKRLTATTDFARAEECDAWIICVPTPLTEHREPDVSYIRDTVNSLAPYLGPGKLVSLESTTYPGTTDELVREILEGASDLKAGADYFLVYSPEREDPGNPTFHTRNIPKVVGGFTPDCLEAGRALYAAAVDQVVLVSGTRTAEMVKLFENIYRAVNIALVNELKLLCHRMEIDVWEVIQAASTKPFGFQAFWPGPGLGGHCIPIDPFYLTWKARQVDMNTRFIELAGEINTKMPYYVVDRIQYALNWKRKSLNGSNVLLLGVAYKPNVDDMRETPALKIMELLQKNGARIQYHDPYVPALQTTHPIPLDLTSTPLTATALKRADCVVVVTDHKDVDYKMVAHHADLVVDTRHVVPKSWGNVVDA